MSAPSELPLSFEPSTDSIPSRLRIRIGVLIALGGLLIFMVGVLPEYFGFDRSPVFGFVQIETFLVGLGILCIGGYVSLRSLWTNGNRSILADIGPRLVTTGFVIALFSGMADVFGFGTQLRPRVPFFGPWQAGGVLAGEALIAIGFLLFIPFRLYKKR